MSQCRIWIEDDEVIISAPYNPRFSETLKNEIPKGKRWWEPEEKVWKTTREYYDQVVEIAEEFFTSVSKKEGKSKKKEEEVDWKVVALRQQGEILRLKELLGKGSGASFTNASLVTLQKYLLNPTVLKDLRRVLAKNFHPDVTKDDGRKMKEINSVLDKLGG